MADLATTDTYKTELKTILDPIVFDNSTLGNNEIIKIFERSINDKPHTVINIFQTNLRSRFLESKLNLRGYMITTRIRCLAIKREEQAQQDMDYLEEQIITKYENNLSRVNWLNGYLDNDEITSLIRNFNDNYYTKDIPLIIKLRVVVNN